MFFTPFCLPEKEANSFDYELKDSDVGFYKTGIIGDKNPDKTKFEHHRHVNAEKVKRIVDQIDPNIWNTYFKFSVVRNPWDMVVSMFYYRRIARNYKDDFDALIKKMGKERNHNYDIYKINNEYICDFHIKYENLENDLKHVLSTCNIENYNLKNFKKFNSNYKPANTDYKKYYNEERKKIIKDLYSDYIEKFNYEF